MTHCDDYADSHTGNPDARWFIFVNRLPYSLRHLAERHGGIRAPMLFADYNGKRVRVTMASRLGDLGVIFENITIPSDGYDRRVWIDELSNFSSTLEAPCHTSAT